MYSSIGNPVLHGLAHGLLITSLVLLERAGASVTLKSEHEEAVREEKVVLRTCHGIGPRPDRETAPHKPTPTPPPTRPFTSAATGARSLTSAPCSSRCSAAPTRNWPVCASAARATSPASSRMSACHVGRIRVRIQLMFPDYEVETDTQDVGDGIPTRST